MACIDVTVTKQKRFIVSVGRVRDCTLASCCKVSESVKASASIPSGTRIAAAAGRHDMGIKASAKKVCMLYTPNYLKVSPNEVAWVDEYTTFTYAIHSNTNWIIE